jgi:hypothetical protein
MIQHATHLRGPSRPTPEAGTGNRPATAGLFRFACCLLLAATEMAAQTDAADLTSTQPSIAGPPLMAQNWPIIAPAVKSRSISWENRTGEPGAGGKEGGGRKGSPAIPVLANGQTVTLMDVQGCGVIRHIWLTMGDRSELALRNLILRCYWDGSDVPSVEVPLGDFFGTAHGRAEPLVSYYTAVILGKSFNSYFPMPFTSRARITLQNDLPDKREVKLVFFQIDYELHEALPPNTGLFHASFRRQNPTVQKQDYVLLDIAEGPGFWLGCVIGVRALEHDWWGEGEIKFYIDDDQDYPTICGTGVEDYFGAAWGLEQRYQAPFFGCTVSHRGRHYKHLVSAYRFHAMDPVFFQRRLKVSMQQIGLLAGEHTLFERSDDWSSVAFWYQLRPVRSMPPLPDQAARSEGIVEPPVQP